MKYCMLGGAWHLCRTAVAMALGMTTMANAWPAEFVRGNDLFLIGSAVAFRVLPHVDAPIAGTLPIATQVTFKGSPTEVAAGPNEECKSAEAADQNKWACVCVPDFIVDYGVGWCGWVGQDLLSAKKPDLQGLVAQYDKVPKNNLRERRQWAERAVALDPLNRAARRRLLGVLEQSQDSGASASANRTFAAYDQINPLASGHRLVFVFNGSSLEPIGELIGGRLRFRSFNQAVTEPFRHRNHTYKLYSRGRALGTVVTEAQFDCGVQRCPVQTIAREVRKWQGPPSHGGVATNFPLPRQTSSHRPMSQAEKARLIKFANDWLNRADLRPKAREAFRAYIRRRAPDSVMKVGSLGRSGRVMLIGEWTMGSMDHQHYVNEDDYYESLLIVAEQQDDGMFRVAPISGSLSGSGCGYFAHFDLDGDGVDEILLECHQLEGQYNFAIIQKRGGRWRMDHGPSRN